MNRSGIVGILLAAGAGSRFGGGKLLHPLADGRRIGEAAACNLAAALPRAIAVVRPGDGEVAAMLAAAGLDVVPCAAAAGGMGHSLACGVRATRDAPGWVVALADMPFIRPATIARVAAAIEAGAPIAATLHDGRRGHPVGFAGRFGAALEALAGDAGARDILRLHAAEIATLDTDDPGVLADIDTRDALARLDAQGRGTA